MEDTHKTITIEIDIVTSRDSYFSDPTTYIVSKIITKTTKFIFRIVRLYNFFNTTSKVRVEGVRCKDFPKK